VLWGVIAMVSVVVPSAMAWLRLSQVHGEVPVVPALVVAATCAGLQVVVLLGAALLGVGH
jgi:hypothetical protein